MYFIRKELPVLDEASTKVLKALSMTLTASISVSLQTRLRLFVMRSIVSPV